LTALTSQYTTSFHQTRSRWTLLLWFLGLMGASGLLGLIMLRGGPHPVFIGALAGLVSIAAIVARPRYGIYQILFLTLVADGLLVPWFPFAKNLSSRESLLYLNDALIFSPLELYLALTALVWGAQHFARRRLSFRPGTLGLPMILFALFMVLGLGYGIGRGGDLNIGLWEVRPMFYLPLMYLLVLNLIKTRSQVSVLMWLITLALFIEGIIGNLHFFFTLEMDLSGVDTITEHSAAIHMNTLFVMVIAVWLFKGSRAKRLVLPLFIPFVLFTYLVTQRRAAFISLVIALILIAVVLYRENRRVFWAIVPAASLVGMLYLAAFWNTSGMLGLPVQGIRSVFADESSGEYRSNIYRIIENVNTAFTIHQHPLLGVGFGNRFSIIVPMPDISFFDWWEYITHNSVLWVWMKAGLAGFMATIFLIGAIIVNGAQAFNRVPGGDLKAMALTMLLYVIMHFTYAYVDMSWDTQSMVYLGTAAGLLAGLEGIAARPVQQRPHVKDGKETVYSNAKLV